VAYPDVLKFSNGYRVPRINQLDKLLAQKTKYPSLVGLLGRDMDLDYSQDYIVDTLGAKELDLL